jgi:hypothetical protein
MRAFAVVLLLFCLASTFPGIATAEFYKYRDANGRLVFVDEEHKIPAQFREQVTSIEEAPVSPVDDNKKDSSNDSETVSVYEELLERREEKRLKKYQTPVVIEKNRVLVPAEVSMGSRTVKLQLLLDTGATRTVFHRQSIAELDLPSGKSYKARVAGGGIVNSKKIQFRKVKIGPFEISKAKAMVINLEGRTVPFDGMLGMDFLKNHPYQIDFENKLIVWENNP